MRLTQTERLSQADMEEWFQMITTEGSRLLSHGLAARVSPKYVSCSYEESRAELAYNVMRWDMDAQNTVHNGIIAAALDTSLGMLCHYYTKPRVVTTVNLNTTYHAPVLLENTFHVKGKIDFLGRSLCTISGEVWTEGGSTLAATATAVFKILRETQHNPLT